MASTTFVDGATVIVASWLNDVNTTVYGTNNANPGTSGSATVIPTITTNSHGLVTAVTTNPVTVTLTGDVTASGSVGGTPATLATVNSNVGTFGDATHVAVPTVNAKGLVTGISNVAINFPTFSVQYAYNTSQFNKTSDTTLANIPGMSVNLVSGGVYKYYILLLFSGTSPNFITDMAGGTATVTTLTGFDESFVGTFNSSIRQNLTTTTSWGSGAIFVRYTGTIVCNAGGTLIPRFAQNSSNATASSVLAYSTMSVERMA